MTDNWRLISSAIWEDKVGLRRQTGSEGKTVNDEMFHQCIAIVIFCESCLDKDYKCLDILVL